MKILLTGGGSGGHFYPIIAVTQALRKAAKEHKLIDMKLYYMAPQPYDKRLLFENDLIFVKCTAGKVRRYFSILNFFDLFRTAWGVIHAIWTLFWLYPDVVFGKGGYVSFPALCAARFLGIPVIVHESDSKPGRVNAWAGRFAKRVAISYPSAAEFFIKDKVAFTGNPIRNEVIHPASEGAHEFLQLESSVPTILILGGSQGAQAINEVVIDSLPQLVQKYQIIHQIGKENFFVVKETANVVLIKSEYIHRYKPYDHLNSLALRMAAGIADVIISRAGSAIFEIAVWGVPSIIIPIPKEVSHDQTENAYNYARSGAAQVIEQQNLTSHILTAEVNRIMSDATLRGTMRKAAKEFSRIDAADLIANEIIALALEHEK